MHKKTTGYAIKIVWAEKQEKQARAASEGKAQHRQLLHRPINTQICVRIRLQSAYKVAAQLTQNQRRFVSNAEQHMENSLL